MLRLMETFVLVGKLGSLTAAARAQNLSPVMVGKRINELEQIMRCKLLLRTTRRISLTDEGWWFYEESERILKELAQARDKLSLGNQVATGHLRITAPAGFGRRHVAPLLPKFQQENPAVTISLNLSDRLVDIENEGYDCAIRVGELEDSNLLAQRLADNRRVYVATPDYLRRNGRPRTPKDLHRFACLALSSEGSQTRGWAFRLDGKVQYIRVSSYLSCSDGQVLTDWCLRGLGIAWRSMWEVEHDIAQGRLETVLDDYAAPASGVYALYVKNKHIPLRLKFLLQFLRFHYSQVGYWTGYST